MITNNEYNNEYATITGYLNQPSSSFTGTSITVTPRVYNLSTATNKVGAMSMVALC